jgi:spermidine/putrescine transport system substrate-binding protein
MPFTRGSFLTPLVVFAIMASASAARAGGQLFIYNWTDYTAPKLIEKFEKETGIKVTIDTYDSNETLLAKLRTGSSGYDIVIGSSDFIPIFVDQKLIQKIEASKWSDYKNIDSRWRSPKWDPNNDYTIPFGWGVTSYAINTKFIKEPADSLKLLFEPPAAARGKVGMMGAPTEVASMAEVYLGLAPCQTETSNMKKVAALLEAQAPFVKVYASDGIIERLSSGETWIQQTWNGDAARAHLANPDLKFIFPKEGAVAWMDNVAIPADARDPDNARIFLHFLLKPENAALSANFTHYASAIAGVDPYLDPSLRDAPEMKVPADLKLSFTPPCSPRAIDLIDRVWTRLKR